MSLARASVVAQRRFAAVLWTLPGIGLSIAGTLWILGHASGIWLPVWLAAGLLVGFGKGRFLRARPATRLLGRIEERGGGAALGAFLGARGIVLLLIMMGAGRLLRMSPLPREILGALYLGIGLALLYASLLFWRAATESRQVATS